MNVVRRQAEPFYVASTTCCVALNAAPYVSSGALGLNVCLSIYGIYSTFFFKHIHSYWHGSGLVGSEDNPKICVEAFLESKLEVSVQNFTCNIGEKNNNLIYSLPSLIWKTYCKLQVWRHFLLMQDGQVW